MNDIGKNTLRYAVIMSIVILVSFAIANIMGCASRRTGDMGDQYGLAISQHIGKK